MNIIIKINLETPLFFLKKLELDIFAALKRQLKKIKKNHIIIIRKLPNNDFLIIISSPKTYKELEEDLRWTKTLAIKNRIITAS